MASLRKIFEMFAKVDSKAEIDALATKLKAQKTTDNADVIDAAKSRREDLRAAADSAAKAPAPGVAGKRAKDAANKNAAKLVEKKGSVAKKMTVSATDIKEAKTALQFEGMQKRLDKMEAGPRKDMMQGLLDRQVKEFKSGQAGDVQRIENKSSQANRDRTKNTKDNVSLPPMMDFNKGGMPKKKKAMPGYAYGGMTSAKPRTGNMDYRMGGMFMKNGKK